MVVIQTNGTDGNWITQKLCKVKLDKGVYNLKLEEVLAGIKVKYIQFKKIPKKINKCRKQTVYYDWLVKA